MEQNNITIRQIFSRFNIIVLASGRGSNAMAIYNHFADRPEYYANISRLITDVPEAHVVYEAGRKGIPISGIDYSRGKRVAEADLFGIIKDQQYDSKPNLVVLAGFMRILSEKFLNEFYEEFRIPILNIHPSLLPKYKGLDTHERVLADESAKVHGASVHLVTPELDGGPVIAQSVVPIFQDEEPEALASRVLRQEHKLFPLVIEHLINGRIYIDLEEQAVFMDGMELFAPIQYLDHEYGGCPRP